MFVEWMYAGVPKTRSRVNVGLQTGTSGKVYPVLRSAWESCGVATRRVPAGV